MTHEMTNAQDRVEALRDIWRRARTKTIIESFDEVKTVDTETSIYKIYSTVTGQEILYSETGFPESPHTIPAGSLLVHSYMGPNDIEDDVWFCAEAISY